jgi:hypothetical protein
MAKFLMSTVAAEEKATHASKAEPVTTGTPGRAVQEEGATTS